jgi:hypothetical protein
VEQPFAEREQRLGRSDGGHRAGPGAEGDDACRLGGVERGRRGGRAAGDQAGREGDDQVQRATYFDEPTLPVAL